MDLGVDEKTGELLYTFHPRRAQQGSLRKLLPVFRKSGLLSMAWYMMATDCAHCLLLVSGSGSLLCLGARTNG